MVAIKHVTIIVRQEYTTVAARMKLEEGVSTILYSKPIALHAISRECGTFISLGVLPRRIIPDSQSADCNFIDLRKKKSNHPQF